MKSFKLAWDKDYGIDKRAGWSITVNGHVLVILERWLIVAACKALWRWSRLEEG